MEQNKKESLIWSNSSVGQLRMRMEITGDGKRGKGSHVHQWKKCNRPYETNGWSSNSMNTLERRATDGVSTRHWLRSPIIFALIKGKLELNEDWEQIETNFSFIVSLCNLYRTYRIWDTSSIICLITVHRKKAPVMVRCIVNSRYVGCIRTIMKVWGKNNLYRISTVEKKPQRLRPV